MLSVNTDIGCIECCVHTCVVLELSELFQEDISTRERSRRTEKSGNGIAP